MYLLIHSSYAQVIVPATVVRLVVIGYQQQVDDLLYFDVQSFILQGLLCCAILMKVLRFRWKSLVGKTSSFYAAKRLARAIGKCSRAATANYVWKRKLRNASSY